MSATRSPLVLPCHLTWRRPHGSTYALTSTPSTRRTMVPSMSGAPASTVNPRGIFANQSGKPWPELWPLSPRVALGYRELWGEYRELLPKVSGSLDSLAECCSMVQPSYPEHLVKGRGRKAGAANACIQSNSRLCDEFSVSFCILLRVVFKPP